MARPPLELETWGKITRFVTPDGKHAARANYRDADGKTRPIQRIGSTPAAAERNLVAALKARRTPNIELSGESTIRTVGDLWFKVFQERSYASGTLNTYEASLRNRVYPRIGDIRLRELTVLRADAFITGIVTDYGRGAARTAKNVLNHIMTYAVRKEAIARNPLLNVEPIPQTKIVVSALSGSDVQAIRAIMRAYDLGVDKQGRKRTTDLGDIADVFAGTGVRTAELFAFEKSDADLTVYPMSVSVSGTVSIGRDGKLFRQDFLKSESGRRVLMAPDFVRDIFVRRSKDSPVDYIFPSATGTLRWPNNLRRAWRDALMGTAYEGVTPKSFRKAVATLLERELGLEAAQGQLGHKPGSGVTRKHYIEQRHQGPDATLILDRVFGKSMSKP